MEPHAAFPDLEDLQRMREVGRQVVEQDVAERPPSTTPSIAVEQQVAVALPRRRRAGGPARTRRRPRNQQAANASRYITPYQWIFSGPERSAIGSIWCR